ncbi:MAG: hypothetical protein GY811_20585 [Myxococcales bacterium]|nr:hypothetical protein [Myxococcales bacterium]
MTRPLSMLRLALILGGALLLIGGCFGSESSELSLGGGSDDGGGRGGFGPPQEGDYGLGEPQQCTQASDCVLAASTCCECPSFAARMGEGYDAGCDAIDCEAPTGLCPAVEATCDSGECIMICSPIQTDKTCAFGFIRDDAGCLTNECATPSMDLAECEIDTDCVQIPADCCGCAQGGEDRAALAEDAEALVDELACPPSSACPEIDVCDSSQIPRCITGSCVLADLSMNPQPDPSSIQLCGTPQLELCPSGSQCVLNQVSAKEASDLGVGSCSPE